MKASIRRFSIPNPPGSSRPIRLSFFLSAVTSQTRSLVLVGADSTAGEDLARRFPGLDLARVERRAQLSQPELAQLYRTADVFLFPSTCEGFGLPVLEAKASGTPVITSTVSSLPEVAGDAAVLVDPNDVNAVYVSLIEVLTDRMQNERLRTAGLARAARFTWEAMARQTLAVYQQVAADRG